MNPQDKRLPSEPIAAAARLNDWRVRPPIDDRPHLWRWIAIALLLIGLKLWLVSHLPIRALDADRDNLRYVILATNLVNRDTTYDAFALLRQPGYPFAIALAHWIGVPLRLWQEAMYLAGGAFLAAIVGAVYQRPRVATLCFGLYALAPFSFHWNRQTLQEVLYLPLIAVWLGCVIAVIECRGLWFWLGTLGGGVTLAVLWNTRPEGVLLVPPIALIWAIVAWRRDREQHEALRQMQRDRLEAEYRDRIEAEAARQDRIEREIEAQLEAQLNGVSLPPSLELQAWETRPNAESSSADPHPSDPAVESINRIAIAREVLIGLGLTIAPVLILTLGICWSNAENFGIFATSDFKTPEFAAAYSALSRVEGSPQTPEIPHQFADFDTAAIVPVPASARAAIYDHSPAFRELRPALEVSPDVGWRSQSCAEGICDDYAGGFFFWALRDAVAAAGYYESPDRAAAFYRQLTTEINAACDDGVLRCRSSLWGMVPALRWQTIPRWLGSLGRLTRQLWQTAIVLKLDVEPDAATIALRQRYYEPIIGEPAEFVTQQSRPENQPKNTLITLSADIYRLIFPILIGLSVLGIAIESGLQLGRLFGATPPKGRRSRSVHFDAPPAPQASRSRSSVYLHDRIHAPNPLGGSTNLRAGVSLGVIGIVIITIACRIVTIAYIDVTSWPVGAGDRYLRPLWPLLWLMITAGLSYAVDRWRQILRPKR